MERGELIDAFKEYAFNVGVKLQLCILEDGSKALELEIDGLIFYVEGDSEDANFVRILLPTIDTPITGNLEKIEAINDLNRSYKMGKVIYNEEGVSISTEQFIYSLESVDALFHRMLTVQFSLFQEYRNRFLKEEATKNVDK